MTKNKLALVAALLALLIPLIGLQITSGTDSAGQAVYTVRISGVTLQVPKSAVDSARGRLEQNLRSENPSGVKPSQLDAACE